MIPVVAGYLQIAREDLLAARQLAPVVPRASAYHLQQAAEKLVKAILAAENIHPTAEHNIGQLVARLPSGHDWKADLLDLDGLSQYATAYRYPTERGGVAPPPERTVLDRYAELIAALAEEVTGWCEERTP